MQQFAQEKLRSVLLEVRKSGWLPQSGLLQNRLKNYSFSVHVLSFHHIFHTALHHSRFRFSVSIMFFQALYVTLLFCNALMVSKWHQNECEEQFILTPPTSNADMTVLHGSAD